MVTAASVCPPRYRDVRWIAAGGMSDVYRAVDENLGRTVAIKVLAAGFADDESVRGRFRREALAAARLSGELNTITVYDVGEWEGRAFIVMEYLPGGSLASLERDDVPIQQYLAWLEQAARSLDAGHALGVVHRDVKPGNLLLDQSGRVRVADFGIATASGLDSFTSTGTILGTSGYLSPEQALGQPASPASDEYALAVVAFEFLTGSRPYEADSLMAVATAHVYAQVPAASARNTELPRSVDAVFRCALAKDPGSRYPSCAAFVAALSAAVATREPAGIALAAGEAPTESRTAVMPPRRLARRWLVPALLLVAGVGVAAALATTLGGSGNKPVPDGGSPTLAAPRTGTPSPPAHHPPPSRPTVSLSSAYQLNTRGYELMLDGHYVAALPLLQRAVTGLVDPANPVTAYVNFNLGQTLVRLGRCSSALTYLERASQLEPQRQEAYDALAYAQQCARSATAPSAAPQSAAQDPHGHAYGHRRHGDGGQGDQGDQGE